MLPLDTLHGLRLAIFHETASGQSADGASSLKKPRTYLHFSMRHVIKETMSLQLARLYLYFIWAPDSGCMHGTGPCITELSFPGSSSSFLLD